MIGQHWKKSFEKKNLVDVIVHGVVTIQYQGDDNLSDLGLVESIIQKLTKRDINLNEKK